MTQNHPNHKAFADQIKQWGRELGFSDVGITDCDLSDYESRFFETAEKGYFGDMHFMQAHGTKRTRPAELVPGTLSLISVRMNYFDTSAYDALQQLHSSEKAYISRYALGKDYHKLLRKRLQQLADKIVEVVPDCRYRAFTDSAPVLEQAIAEKSGLGFIGKNSLIIHPRAGSWFFLGELYLNISLPADPPFDKQGCGPCTACIQECPTQAILDNNQVDARRCISYLTIEFDGIIPEAFRALMGNRIYGCDDCQLVCPWNRFSSATQEERFKTQYQLDDIELLELWQWSESKFLKHFSGSAIRRIGYQKWQRNLAVALGNIRQPQAVHKAISALNTTLNQSQTSRLVAIHIEWSLQQLTGRLNSVSPPTQPTKTLQSPHPYRAKKYYYPADQIKRRGSE